MATDYDQVLSELPFPALRHLCVERIVHGIDHILEGMDFDQLASPRHSFILGPFSCLDPDSIRRIWKYLLKINKMGKAWLSLLIVPHLRVCVLPSSLSSSLKVINTRCHQLTELSLYQSGVAAISTELLCQVIQRNLGLQEFHISCILRSMDKIILTLAHYCPELTVLDIPNNPISNPIVLEELCGSGKVCGCQDLQELNLEFVPLERSESVMVHLLKGLKNLQILNICGTSLNVHKVWEALHTESKALGLTELDVSCLDITGGVFTHIGLVHPNIRKLNCLDTSFFEGTKQDFNFPNMNDLAIATPNDDRSILKLNSIITKVGNNLAKLHIGNYCGYPTVSWNIIVKNCPNLEHLDLSYCKINIPPDDEITLVLNYDCPKILELILHRTEIKINNRPVVGYYGAILGPCQQLREFQAHGTSVADVDIITIFSSVYTNRIQMLELSHTDVSTDALIQVLSAAPCLERIKLHGCKRVDVRGHAVLKSKASESRRVHPQILWE